MSIAFKCTSCERVLRANPEMSGKKTKCPGCATVLTIPAAASVTTHAPKPAATATTPAAGAVLTCGSCGAKIRSKPEWAGKAVKCPKCQEKIKVPGAIAIAAAPVRSAPKKPAPPVDDDDDPFRDSDNGDRNDDRDDDDEPTSTKGKKKKAAPAKKSNKMLLFALLGVAVLGAGGFAIYAFVFDKPANINAAKGIVKDDGQLKKFDKADKGGADDGSAAEYVDAEAIGFISIRPEAFLKTALGKKFLAKLDEDNEDGKKYKLFCKEFGVTISDLAEGIVYTTEMPGPMSSPDDSIVVLRFSKPIEPAGFESDELKFEKKKAEGKPYFFHAEAKRAFYQAGPKVIVVGSDERIQAYISSLPTPVFKAGPLEPVIKNAADSQDCVFVGFQVPEALKKIPEAQAAGVLLNARYGQISIAEEEGLKLDVKLTFGEPGAAKTAKEMIDKALPEMSKQLDGVGFLPPAATKFIKPLQDGLKGVKTTQSGQTVNILVSIGITLEQLGEALAPMIDKNLAAAASVVSSNNLRQLGLAMHNYHDANKSLPPAKLGNGLSWRVALLPYLEQASLFKSFDQTQPWDSPKNKKLLAAMPKVFEHPTRKAPAGYTYYRVFVGPSTIFEEGKKMTMQGIADGTSNTILIVEAADAVPWTKADELVYSPDEPLPKVGDPTKDGQMLLAFADGSVDFIAAPDEATMRALITATGAEPIDRSQIKRLRVP